jgi:hypothetical protein
MYHRGMRSLQDLRETRPLANRLVQVTVRTARRASSRDRGTSPRRPVPGVRRDYSASALMGRLINSRTASFAGSCSKRTRYTIAQSGISTCARAATVTMARAAA